MNLSLIRSRIRLSIKAAVAGWGLALAATLPLQFFKIRANSFDGAGALLWSFAAGAVVWIGWTAAIATLAWLFGGLIMLAIVRERWLLAHRRLVTVIAGLMGWTMVLIEHKVWELPLPDHSLNRWEFALYSVLLTVFVAATAAVYLLLLARRQHGDGSGSVRQE